MVQDRCGRGISLPLEGSAILLDERPDDLCLAVDEHRAGSSVIVKDRPLAREGPLRVQRRVRRGTDRVAALPDHHAHEGRHMRPAPGAPSGVLTAITFSVTLFAWNAKTAPGGGRGAVGKPPGLRIPDPGAARDIGCVQSELLSSTDTAMLTQNGRTVQNRFSS